MAKPTLISLDSTLPEPPLALVTAVDQAFEPGVPDTTDPAMQHPTYVRLGWSCLVPLLKEAGLHFLCLYPGECPPHILSLDANWDDDRKRDNMRQELLLSDVVTADMILSSRTARKHEGFFVRRDLSSGTRVWNPPNDESLIKNYARYLSGTVLFLCRWLKKVKAGVPLPQECGALGDELSEALEALISKVDDHLQYNTDTLYHGDPRKVPPLRERVDKLIHGP